MHKNSPFIVSVVFALSTSIAQGQTSNVNAPDLEAMVISSSRYYQTPFEASSSIDLINCK